MGLPSKFYKIHKGGLDDIVCKIEDFGLFVIRNKNEVEVRFVKGGDAVCVDVIFENAEDFVCVIVIHITNETLRLFSKVCGYVEICGGKAISGKEIPE